MVKSIGLIGPEVPPYAVDGARRLRLSSEDVVLCPDAEGLR
jgi:hypothetical protein